jgi:hypothetical protein
MNEKIKELWNQVDTIQWYKVYGEWYIPYIPLQIYGEPTRFEITDIHLEKFAELIIKECVQMCEGNGEYKNHVDTEWGKGLAAGIELCKEVMKQHFGVEK